MSLEGTLDELTVPDILQMVAQQGKTGILTVQGEETIIAVSFLSGDVVAADSLQETVEDRLGEVLVREGKLTRDEFSAAAKAQSGSQGRLIDLLVDEGYLSRQDVLDSLRVQTRDLLAELMGWTSGDFKFYVNDEVAYEEGFQPIVVGDLLISLLPEQAPAGAGAPGDETGDTAFGGLGDELGGGLEGDLGADAFEGSFTPLPDEGGGPEDGWSSPFGDPEPDPGGDAGFTDHGELGGLELREPGFTEPPLEDPGESESFTDHGGALGQVVPLPVTQREPETEPAEAPEEGAIFVPPDGAVPKGGEETPRKTPERQPRPAERPPARRPAGVEAPAAAPGAGDAAAVLPPALAALLVAAVVLALATMPARVLLPLPWQDSERADYEMAQRQAAYRTIDGAAKIFFLVEGRFPDTLERLVEGSLLHRHDLTDPAGQPLEIEAREESYVLRPVPEDGSAPEPAHVATEAITGNFLLDPEYLNARPLDTVPPLVLLD